MSQRNGSSLTLEYETNPEVTPEDDVEWWCFESGTMCHLFKVMATGLILTKTGTSSCWYLKDQSATDTVVLQDRETTSVQLDISEMSNIRVQSVKGIFSVKVQS